MKAVKVTVSARSPKVIIPAIKPVRLIRQHAKVLQINAPIKTYAMSSYIFHKTPKRCFATTSSSVLKADDDNFEEVVINGSKKQPIIVDCYADWCGPCRVLGPKLETLVAATNGAVKLAVVDVDENGETAAKLRVSSIPAVFAYHQGKIVDSFIGLLSDANLQQFVQDVKALK